MSHNVHSIEEGTAEGFLPHDIIVQVDTTVGASLGERGGDALIEAMNSASSCTIHVVRRADRFEDYLRTCNAHAMRSEEHDLQFEPPLADDDPQRGRNLPRNQETMSEY
jgi:hypothetical protein